VNDGWRRWVIAVAIAYLAFAGYILGRYANSAFPTFYLYRPLVLVIPVAIVVGLLAAWLARSHAPVAVGVVTGVICFWATFSRHWWQAALLVGVIVAVIGGLLVQRGLAALKHADLAPRKTMETLKEDTQWAKDRMK